MKESDIKALRGEIDGIDEKIVRLLGRRMEISSQIGVRKSDDNLKYYHPEREKEVFDRLLAMNRDSLLPDEALKLLYSEIISVSRSLQRPLRIAYLGPRATYTHMALIKQFGSANEAITADTVPDVFRAVENGHADYGVVPVENSTEGGVSSTLDQFVQSGVRIVSEVYLRISHCLLSNCPDFQTIRKLYAHPQGIAQCRNWIQANLPQAEVIEASSNARAAAIVAWEKYGAAIAGRIAASEYELSVLAEHIEDFSGNTTRFFVIGNDDCRPTGSDKTSLVCSVKDRPGALSDLLGAFSSRSINMTRIESRPTRKKAWEYLFYIDVDGHYGDQAIREALAELDHATQFLKILGSYPVGRFYET